MSYLDTAADRITVLAREFTPAAMEYHRREMGKKGYQLHSAIKQQSFYVIEGPGEPTKLFDGEEMWAATFVRAEEKEQAA